MQLAQAAVWERECGWSYPELLKASQQVLEIRRKINGEEFLIT